MSHLKNQIRPNCMIILSVPVGMQVSMGTTAGQGVFPRCMFERPRLLPSVQHLRPIGACLCRLLVRVVVQKWARLLPQVPVLWAARCWNPARRWESNHPRHVHERAVAELRGHLLLQRVNHSTCLTELFTTELSITFIFESLMNIIESVSYSSIYISLSIPSVF